jgi:hypothetical protein
MALSAIQEACALPGATSFQLQTFLDRLDLLGDLDQHCPFVQKALSIVSEAIKSRDRECKTCERVLLWGGYPIEQPGRPGFAADDVSRISGEIDCALNHWGLSANDLAICSGMTESDILFAKACLDRHVRVRLMIREPVGEELNQPLWPFAEPDWREKFHELRANNLIDVWEDTEHLGSPPKGNSANDAGEFVRRRHNQWLLNTACMEAEPKTIVEREEPLSEQVAIPCKKAQSGAPVSPSPPRLYGLFLWDGKGNPNDPKDIPYLIRRISDYAEYQGQVTIIPMEIPQNDAGNPKANHANAGWG